MLPVVQKCKTRTPLGFPNLSFKNRDIHTKYSPLIKICIFFGKKKIYNYNLRHSKHISYGN